MAPWRWVLLAIGTAQFDPKTMMHFIAIQNVLEPGGRAREAGRGRAVAGRAARVDRQHLRCLGSITEVIAELVKTRDPVIVEIADHHRTTASLAAWIRTPERPRVLNALKALAGVRKASMTWPPRRARRASGPG